MLRRAEQHRLALERQPAFALAQHLVGDPACLRGFVVDADQPRPRRRHAFAPEVLREALGGQFDDRVRRFQDGLRRAVVVLQRDDARRRVEGLRKVEDVARLGGAEGVDRLRVVADHRESVAVGPQREQDLGLQAVRVLVFVDQHGVEAGGDRGSQRRLLHHMPPDEQQIVVVEQLLGLLLGAVGLEQGHQLGLPGCAPGVDVLQQRGQRQPAVHCARVDRQAGGGQRKPVLRAAQIQALARHGHQVLRVGAVEDAELRRQPDARRQFAQQPCTDAVEGAAPGQRRRRRAGRQAQRLVQQAADAARHLAGGAAREGHQQRALRIGAVEHLLGHARGQGHGLAGAGTGDHQQRPAAVQRGLALIGIQFGKRRQCSAEAGSEA